MSEIPQDLEQEAKPQPKTKSQEVYEALKGYKYEQIKPDLKKELAQHHKCSVPLVQKMFKKLKREGFWRAKGIEPAPTPTPKEPIIKVKPEPQIEIVEEEPDQIPKEFIGEEPAPTPEPTPPEPEIIGFDPEDVSYMLDLGFNKIADATDYEGWKLQPNESEKLGKIWSPIINKYLPQLIPYAPEIMGCATTVLIIAPRIWGWRKHKGEQEEKKKAKEEKKAEEQKPPEQSEEPPKEPELSLEEKKIREGAKLQAKFDKL